MSALAEIRNYRELVAALWSRAHTERIPLSDPEVSRVAGLPERYLPKVLGPGQNKRLGLISLGPVLSVLGVKLILVIDTEAEQRIMARLPRMAKPGPAKSITITLSRRQLKERARLGGHGKAISTRRKTQIAELRRERQRRKYARDKERYALQATQEALGWFNAALACARAYETETCQGNQ